jgi:hypothetical protein
MTRDSDKPFLGEEQIEKTLTSNPLKLYLDVEKEFDAIRDKAQDLLWPENQDEARWSDVVDSYAEQAGMRMTECIPDNGFQVIMFTHQSGSIWADMANIVWASGLHVTAAWYVVTETESAVRQGNNVKGTVLLVCRKRHGKHKTTRDDLAWEIQEEVESQVCALTGLNQEANEFGRTEMSEGSEFHESVLRAVLYAVMELVKNMDSAEVLAHLILNIPDYYGNVTQRELAVEMADYLAKHLEQLRPEEATAARVLRELVKNQRLG